MIKSLNINRNDRILIVAPHPDDESIGCGGLLCLYSDQCDVLVLTDGRLGQGNMSQEKMKSVREKEFISAMNILNPNSYHMLGIQDGTLMTHTNALEEYDLSKYTIIFSTGDVDGHLDHTAAYVCVKNAVLKQGLSDAISVYKYEVHIPLTNPTHFVDITDVMSQKRDMIMCHESQTDGYPYERVANTLSEYRALQNNMPGCKIEAFELADIQSEDVKFDSNELELRKQRYFYYTLINWLGSELKGKSLADKLRERNVSTVAIYGYAEMGKLLTEEMDKSEDVSVEYILDKKEFKDEKHMIYRPQTGLRKPDCVIVTAIFYFDQIKKELESLGYTNIISLVNLVEE